MKRLILILVSLVALTAMIMPVSAYWQVWYTDNPRDTANDGLSNVVFITPMSNPDIEYWCDRYNVNNGNFQGENWWYGTVPATLPAYCRHNTDWYPNQGYIFGVADFSGPEGEFGVGYYNDPSAVNPDGTTADSTEMYQNYEGMTTYVEWFPEFDPWTYGEYYNWDPEALMWDPGNSIQNIILCPFAT